MGMLDLVHFSFVSHSTNSIFFCLTTIRLILFYMHLGCHVNVLINMNINVLFYTLIQTVFLFICFAVHLAYISILRIRISLLFKRNVSILRTFFYICRTILIGIYLSMLLLSTFKFLSIIESFFVICKEKKISYTL